MDSYAEDVSEDDEDVQYVETVAETAAESTRKSTPNLSVSVADKNILLSEIKEIKKDAEKILRRLELIEGILKIEKGEDEVLPHLAIKKPTSKSVTPMKKMVGETSRNSDDSDETLLYSSPSKRTRNPFTEDDRDAMVKFLLKNTNGGSLSSQADIWKQMEKDVIFNNPHTHQSLENHYRKRVRVSLEKYTKNDTELKKLKRN